MTLTPPSRLRKRDPYLDVCDRARAAVERANTTRALSRFDLRVFGAVLHYTALRSWFSDVVTAQQLGAVVYADGEFSGFSRDDVTAALRTLRECGIVDVEKIGKTRGTRYLIGLPEIPADATRNTDRNPGDCGPENVFHNPGDSDPSSTREIRVDQPTNPGRRSQMSRKIPGYRGGTPSNTRDTRARARARDDDRSHPLRPVEGPLAESLRNLARKVVGE